MAKVGFKPSWMEKEEETKEAVSNVQNEIGVTPAHAELIQRATMVEHVLKSSQFARMSKAKKEEFVHEYRWLISLNAQLGGI